MRTTDIVLRLHDNIPELEIGSAENYNTLYKSLRQSIANRSADIVHKGDYFRYDQHLLPEDADEFTTYVLFRELDLDDQNDESTIWEILEDEAIRLNFPEVRENNGKHQLIELSTLPADIESTGFSDDDFEEVLIRIAGSREELEFDPSGPEGNTILYDKLAKLIYDKDAEIMYKGPKLVLDENRDLFINSDDFSIYILFRAHRNSNYEDNDQLWFNLSNDLKVLSSITLLRSAENYQVILFTHADILQETIYNNKL